MSLDCDITSDPRSVDSAIPRHGDRQIAAYSYPIANISAAIITVWLEKQSHSIIFGLDWLSWHCCDLAAFFVDGEEAAESPLLLWPLRDSCLGLLSRVRFLRFGGGGGGSRKLPAAEPMVAGQSSDMNLEAPPPWTAVLISISELLLSILSRKLESLRGLPATASDSTVS